MLLCISLLVFGMLAWLMPQTYSNRLNTILDKRAQDFISELEQVPFSDSGGLFDQFVADTEINSVELYNSAQLLPQVLDVRINHTLVPIKIVPPQFVQKVLSGQNTPLISKQFFQHFKFSLCQFISSPVHCGRIIVAIQNEILVSNRFVFVLLRPAAPPQDGGLHTNHKILCYAVSWRCRYAKDFSCRG